MKYLSLFTLFAIFLSSCNKDIDETDEFINYEGTFKSKLSCSGELEEANGEEVTILIIKNEANNTYSIDLGDDAIFIGAIQENKLIIAAQTINEEFDFDVVTLDGVITKNEDDSFQFNFLHTVDDEGESQCDLVLLRL